MTFEGHVVDGKVVVDQPLPLPDGTAVRVEAIESAPVSFWDHYSLNELARQQGVASPSADPPTGGWPIDEVNDLFEESLRAWRERESDQVHE